MIKLKSILLLLVIVTLVVIPVNASTTVTIYATNSSDTDFLRAVHNTTFTDLRNGAGSSYHDTTPTLASYIQSDLDTNTFYRLYRSAISFDTSSIPDNATITSAKIGLYRFSNYTTLGDTAINLVKFNVDGSFSADDYDNFGNTLFSTNKSASSLTSSQYYNFSLNEFGINNISLTGTSSFGIEFGFDLDNVTPTWSSGGSKYSGAAFYAADNVVNVPFIEITYTINPTYTATFRTTNLTDGYIVRTVHNETFGNLHNAATGDTTTAGAAGFARMIADNQSDRFYQLYRGVLIFDTSTLPDNATITSAKLGFFKYYRVSDLGDFGVGITKFTVDGTISDDDFNNFEFATLSPYQNISSMTTNQWYNWTLNQSGLNWISTTGSTGFGTLTQYDIENITPPWIFDKNSQITYRTAENMTNQEPILEVTYTLPSYIITYPLKDINDTQILPTSDTYLPPENSNLFINITPDEITQSSFVIKPLANTTMITINATNFTDGLGHTIYSNATDITIVKVWHQSRNNITYSPLLSTVKNVTWNLTPELLLYNDSIIRVNTTEQKDDIWVKNSTFEGYVDIDNTTTGKWLIDYKIFDNKTTEGFPVPFPLNVNTNKQIVITTHVLADTPEGNYTGKIWINSSETEPTSLNVTIRVLPFTLVNSSKEHGFYGLSSTSALNQYTVSATMYETEMANLKAHGILYPELITPTIGYTADTETMLDIRDNLNFPKDRLLIHGYNHLYSSPTNANIQASVNHVTNMTEVAAAHGYNTSNLYFYGIDEPADEATLLTARPFWENMTAVGGKIYMATGINSSSVVDVFDLPITFDDLGSGLSDYNWETRNYFHAYDKEVYVYSHPAIGIEYPETYRKRYGLGLIEYDFDGGYPYQFYRHPRLGPTLSTMDYNNTTWNEYYDITGDISSGKYKKGGFVYPKADGYVNTLSYEAYREGVYDQRYAETLDYYTGSNISSFNIINSGFISGLDMMDIRNNLITEILNTIVPPTTSFTTNATTGIGTTAIQFNDTSSDEPNSWNWTFTNVTGNNTEISFSTIQNTSHIFGIGNYSIKLNASNEFGSNISTQITFINISADSTPPNSITNLTNITTCNSINWTWTNPSDSDFNTTIIYRNNSWYANVTNTTVTSNWTGLAESTSYTFSSRTCDLSGNCNETFVNSTSTTDVCPIPPTPTPTPTPSSTLTTEEKLAQKMEDVQGFIVIGVYMLIGGVIITLVATGFNGIFGKNQ